MEFIRSVGDSFYEAFITEHRYINYLNGFKVTILISLMAVLIGLCIGILIAIVKVTKQYANKTKWYHNVLTTICNIYVGLIRGTPVFLQLLIIYNLIFTSRGSNEIMIAAVAFGINSGAYVAEIVRAGICSVDRGQMEAGRSLGLSSWQTMRYVILPQAIKNILPALGNEFITLIKETSVASVIAVKDATQVARAVSLRTYDLLTPLIIVAIFYLIIVLGLTKLMNLFERRLARSDTY